MHLPLVSCIMPTANRPAFIPYALDYFLHQDYPNKELIILDDSTAAIRPLVPAHKDIRYYYESQQQTIGKKRNLCCDLAKGHIILHWDDDDWYAQDWISRQADALITSGADLTGLSQVDFFAVTENKLWKYRNQKNIQPWVYGATMAYWRSFWQKHPFENMNTGEDNVLNRSDGCRIYAHNYTKGYLGIIHSDNAGIVLYEDPREKLELSKWITKIKEPQVKLKPHDLHKMDCSALVSCIMPTANRRAFIPRSVEMFLAQDYAHTELIIIDDGQENIADLIPEHPAIHYYYYDQPLGNIGSKRNIACEKASGELIMHWDDDDWYATDWITHQVNAIVESNADICGINQVQFYSPSLGGYWMTKNSNSKRPWLTGASLIYRKNFWKLHPFKDLQIGEDDDYVRNTGAEIFAHDYFQGFIATLHPTNTSTKFFEEDKQKIVN